MSENSGYYSNPHCGSLDAHLVLTMPLSSGQIKSILGRYYLRDRNSLDCDLHHAAEQYKTHQRLALAHIQNLKLMAQQCAAVQQDEETQLLLKVGESRAYVAPVDPEIAIHLARSAKETLVAEEQLALSKLRESQLMTSMLQDAVEEARVHISDAEIQLGHLIHHLDDHEVPLPYGNGISKRLPASVVSTYQSELNANRSVGSSFGSNFPSSHANGSSSSSTYSGGSEVAWEDSDGTRSSPPSFTELMQSFLVEC